MSEIKTRIPILLVTGFLGAGKTTFINWLIHAIPEKKISLILNEFGDIKLESNFIKKEGIGLVTELANGCMCCVAKSDIPRVIRYTLENAPSTETILIEASGLSDPDPVRDVLQFGDLTDLVRLDTIVCIVDAKNFGRDRDLHPIIISQIGDADIVLISKAMDLTKDEIELLKETIGNVGIGTKVLLWDDHLKPSYFLDPNIKRSNKESLSKHEHAHELIDEYWYIADSGLDPQKLFTAFSLMPTNIIRAKGYSLTNDKEYLIQFVGSKLELSNSNVDGLVSSQPKTAILFLGSQLNHDLIRSKLDDCRIM